MFEKAECEFRYGFSLLTVVIYALFYLLSQGLSIYNESLPGTVKISASVSHVHVCMTTPRYCYFFYVFLTWILKIFLEAILFL